MNSEKDFLVLISFAAVGITIASGLAAIFDTFIVIPVTIFGLIMIPLILLQNQKKFAHLAENLEKLFFFLTLIIIIISFILIYKPY